MAGLKPQHTVRTCDGTNATDPVRIPGGSRGFQISPRTSTVTLNFGFTQDEALDDDRAAQLLNGQGYELQLRAPDVFEDFDLFLFASAALVVDVVWW